MFSFKDLGERESRWQNHLFHIFLSDVSRPSPYLPKVSKKICSGTHSQKYVFFSAFYKTSKTEVLQLSSAIHFQKIRIKSQSESESKNQISNNKLEKVKCPRRKKKNVPLSDIDFCLSFPKLCSLCSFVPIPINKKSVKKFR